MQRRRIMIVGGVAAGPAAAAEARRTDPDAEVVLFEEGRDVSYGACELPYIASGRIGDPDRVVRLTPEELSESRGIDVRVLHRVEQVDATSRRITVRDLASGVTTVERFDSLILATGARARTDHVEGNELPGVSALRTLEDGMRLREALLDRERRHVVVVGAGLVGLETASELALNGHRVTVLDPGGPAAMHLSPGLAEVLSGALLRSGITVRRERAVRIMPSATGSPLAVATDRGERIGTHLVILASGLEPRTELGRAAGLRTGRSGAYTVDPGMNTTRRSIWACGDCAEVRRLPDGAPRYVPLAPAAFRSARVAGHNAARLGRTPEKTLPPQAVAFVAKVAGLEIASVGLTVSAAQESSISAAEVAIRHVSASSLHADSRPLHAVLVFDRSSGKVLGAQLVGERGAAERANVIVALMHAGGNVHQLHDLDLGYAPPLSPSIDALTVAAGAAQKVLGRR